MTRSLTILLLACASGASAQQGDDRALQIVEEANRRVTGFHDFTASLTMVLRDADGGERAREMLISGLEVPGDGTRTLLVFDAPRDLRGTSVLTAAHPGGRTEQWLYLPAVRRVRRIASGDQTDAFMGSEFTYEDMGTLAFDAFEYRYVRQESLGSVAMHVLEREPTSDRSAYARQVMWLDTEEFRVHRIEYFAQDDTLIKTLEMEGFREFAGGQWRPATMVMTDPESGRSTVLTWGDYAFGTGLTEDDFDPRRLGRPG